jgi:hypothetical protein
MGNFAPGFEVVGGSQEPFPTSPGVRICLDTWTEHETGGIIISSLLMTDDEIDADIDYKIRVLQELRPKLKRALRAKRPR